MPTVIEDKPTPGRRRGRYPKDFRRDAAALVIDQNRTVADVARELGVIEQTLGNRVRQERIDRGEREGKTTEMREENVRLRREVKRLTMERDLTQTKCGLLGIGAGPVSRYRFVSTMKAEGFPVQAACEAAEVSSSAYYDWLERSKAPTDAEWDEALLINEMYDVHENLDDTYGSPRMTGELRRRGFCDNHKRVERLMAENAIYARDGRRRKVRTTTPDVSAPPLPDLVKRDFSVGEPGLRTCGVNVEHPSVNQVVVQVGFRAREDGPFYFIPTKLYKQGWRHETPRCLWPPEAIDRARQIEDGD